MQILIIIAVVLVAGLAIVAALQLFVGGRTGTSAGGCDAAHVEWTEAMQFFYLTEMMGDSPPRLLGRDPLVRDDTGQLSMIGRNRLSYDADGRLATVGTESVTYDADGRAVTIGIVPVETDALGRIVAVGKVLITYDEDGRVELIGDACARYDESGRLTNIGWDPVLYP